MATFIPGIDLNQIIEGRTLGDQWNYYTVNVKHLGTMTHAQFCLENPEAAREIERASNQLDRLEKLMQSFKDDA